MILSGIVEEREEKRGEDEKGAAGREPTTLHISSGKNEHATVEAKVRAAQIAQTMLCCHPAAIAFTHSLTRSLTHSLTNSPTRSLTRSLTHSPSH